MKKIKKYIILYKSKITIILKVNINLNSNIEKMQII